MKAKTGITTTLRTIIFWSALALLWSGLPQRVHAQLDTAHYMPPLAFMDSTPSTGDINHHNCVLTTPISEPFEVFLRTPDGSFTNRVMLSRDNPQRISLGSLSGADMAALRDSYVGIVDKSRLNQPLSNEGLIATADSPFMMSIIQRSGSQGGIVTAKGRNALGTSFHSGHLLTLGSRRTAKNQFISVMATEDNTLVRFENDRNYLFSTRVDNALTNGPLETLLQEGECYVVGRHMADDATDFNDIIGTRILSDKPIAVTSGTFLGGSTSGDARDLGADQIVPDTLAGNEHICFKGNGGGNLERVIVVATEGNTTLTINGVSTNTVTLTNRSDYAVLETARYSTNGIMAVKTDETTPIHVWQQVYGASGQQTAGMYYIPRLSTRTDTNAVLSLNEHINGFSFNNTVINLSIHSTNEVIVVGTDGTSAVLQDFTTALEVPENPEWSSYRISAAQLRTALGGLTTNLDLVEFIADGSINMAIFLVNVNAGAAGYFSGFAPSAPPEMLLLGPGNSIISNQVPASLELGTDMGAILTNQMRSIEFSVTNAGGSHIEFDAIGWNGSGSEHFSLTNFPLNVGFNAVETFQILYHPTATGLHEATLWISNNTAGARYEINLRGQGLLPGGLNIDPSPITFAATYAGANPTDQQLLISNSGDTPIDLTFESSASWLTLSPETRSLAGKSSANITLSIDISGLDADTYTATNTITSTNALNTPQTFIVELDLAPANQTIDFPNPGNQYTTNIIELSASASSGLPPTFSVIYGPGVITGASTLSFTNSGSVRIKATQDGDGNWNPIFRNRTFTISRTPQTISFPDPGPQVVNGTLELNATASSEENVSYRLSGPATRNGDVLTFNEAGIVVIEAYQDGNLLWAAAPAVERRITINQANAPITFGDLEFTYDGTPKAATVTTEPAGMDVSLTYNGSTQAPTNAGTYTVVATINDPRYQGSATRTMTISKGEQEITIRTQPEPQVVNATLELEAVVNSPLNLNYSITGPATLIGPNITFTNSGEVVVTVAQKGNANWNEAEPKTITFQVEKATSPITFRNLSHTYDGTPKMASVITEPAGMDVSLTYDGSTQTPTNAGTYTVIATINDPRYQGSATRTMVIAKATADITFQTIETQVITNSLTLDVSITPPELEPDLDLHLVGTNGILEGTTLTFDQPGEFAVIAALESNKNWKAAAITNTFSVTGVITNITPNVGSTNGLTEVVLSGLYLGNGNDITNVWIGDISAEIITQDLHSVTLITPPSSVTGAVEVVLESGWGTLSIEEGFTYLSPLSAPEALSAIDVTTSGFMARWKLIDGATYYTLDLSESTNFTTTVDTDYNSYSNFYIGTSGAFPINGLTNGNTYFYRIRAISSGGESEPSNIIEVPVGNNTPYIAYEIDGGVASENSSDQFLLADLLHGTDMSYTIQSNSNPDLVEANLIGDHLFLNYQKGQGEVTLTIRATDEQGFWVDNTLTINIIPNPDWTVGPVSINYQNGLYEQVITVTNRSDYFAAESVTLTAIGLRDDEALYNGTGTDPNGNPEVHWIGRLEANSFMQFVLQYHTPNRRLIPNPDIQVSISLEEPRQTIEGASIPILDYAMIEQNGTPVFLIEFPATVGEAYYVQYTDSLLEEWETVRPAIVAPVNKVQWLDEGPPATDRHPSEVDTRFYRVIQASE